MLTTRSTRWLALLLLGVLTLTVPGSTWLGLGGAEAQPKEFRVGVAI